jgi:phosphatidylglycerophosphatase A
MIEKKPSLLRGFFYLFITTAGYSGFTSWLIDRGPFKKGKAGGTMGSIVGAVIFVAANLWAQDLYIQGFFQILVYMAALGGCFLLGIHLVEPAESFMYQMWGAGPRHTGKEVIHDRNETNIDEVLGVWIALIPVFFLEWYKHSLDFMVYSLVGLIFFRIFDIWKPGPVRWTEEYFNDDPASSVMLDDVVAGVLALFPTWGVVYLMQKYYVISELYYWWGNL